MNTENKRGGSRAGAGRKPKDPSGAKEQYATWLTPDVIKHIKRQDNQAEYLESLVRKDMGI